MLRDVDRVIFGQPASDTPERITLLHRMYPYIERELGRGIPLMRVARHLLGLFHGMPNAKRWRRYLSENGHRDNAGIEVLQQAERLLD